DQAGNEGFLFRRTAFTLEIAARDLAGGEGLFLVVDGQREEIETGLRLLGRHDGRENNGLAVGSQNSAVSLTRDLAGLEDERTTAPLDFDFVVIEHILSFNAETWSAAYGLRGHLLASFGTSHGQDNGTLQWCIKSRNPKTLRS